MIYKKNYLQKAAALTAAFCILTITTFAAAKNKERDSEFDTVKKKAINLLIQKQKKQALGAIEDYIERESSKSNIKEAKDFKLSLAQKFLTKEAQESYELSLNLTLENPKEAKKNNEDCLARDPENLDCALQRLRLFYREKQKKPADTVEVEKASGYFESTEGNWVKASMDKKTTEFLNANFYKKENKKLVESNFIFAVLELDRTVLTKNFSKAKEVFAQIEKDYPDWPDLIFFKNKMDLDLTDEKGQTSAEMLTLYLNKCKSLPKSVVRKYRYDFDLCARGAQ